MLSFILKKSITKDSVLFLCLSSFQMALLCGGLAMVSLDFAWTVELKELRLLLVVCQALACKSMKFKDEYARSSRLLVNKYIDLVVRHLPREGVIGIKVKIILDSDPKGKQGPPTPLLNMSKQGPLTLLNMVTILNTKEEQDFITFTVSVATDIEVIIT